MNGTYWKRSWKIAAAAVGLAAAGLVYGFTERSAEFDSLNAGEPEVYVEQMAGADQAVGMAETVGAVGGDGLLTAAEYREDAGPESVVPESMGPPATCFVHVCGEVEVPGVYEVPEGSRIFEAVELAGGLTEDAAETCVNLAQTVTDGMQIAILSREAFASQRKTEAEEPSGLVNLNTASKEQLMTLPGIGEAKAGEILQYREQSGGFQTIEEIMNISGIKDASFQKIKDQITV